MGFKLYLAFCWLKNAFSGKNTILGVYSPGYESGFPELLLLEAAFTRIFRFFRTQAPFFMLTC